MDRTEIYTSKKKSLFLLLGSLAFVAVAAWLLMNTENLTGWRARNQLLVQGVAVVAILFFGLCAFIAIKRLLRSELSLVIDEKGLTFSPHKSSATSIGWDDILGFKEIKIQSQQILVIVVKDPEAWIQAETSAFKRKLMQFNLNQYGSPFNTAAAGLDITHEELVEKLETYLEKYQKNVPLEH